MRGSVHVVVVDSHRVYIQQPVPHRTEVPSAGTSPSPLQRVGGWVRRTLTPQLRCHRLLHAFHHSPLYHPSASPTPHYPRPQSLPPRTLLLPTACVAFAAHCDANLCIMVKAPCMCFRTTHPYPYPLLPSISELKPSESTPTGTRLTRLWSPLIQLLGTQLPQFQFPGTQLPPLFPLIT